MLCWEREVWSSTPPIALVRSIAVSDSSKGRGLGKEIISSLEKIARDKKITSLYLLTTTAAEFFHKLGYSQLKREQAPAEIKNSTEFRDVCPSSATLMHKELSSQKKLLFVCIENSNRSQMAQAFATLYGGNNIKAFSAGSNPSGKINPKAIKAMNELGYNLEKNHSKSLQEVESEAPFDVVVTMGCGDACPWMPAKKFIDWQIPDPRNMEGQEFNEIRDLVGRKVKELVDGLLLPESTIPSQHGLSQN